jgi:uncharacterized protein YuzE
MRVRVDHGADAVYLNLTDRPIEASEEVADGIVVDYDAEGRIVGVEILDASKRTVDPLACNSSTSRSREKYYRTSRFARIVINFRSVINLHRAAATFTREWA